MPTEARRSQPPGGGAPRRLALVALAALAAVGCRQDMHDAPRVEPLEASAFFADGLSARQPIPGTVARGELLADPALLRGLDEAGQAVARAPFPVDRELLLRGRQRYDIFCSPCHDRLGTGNGMIVRRGFKQPNSLHTERLREAPVGYFFDVASNGFGQMPAYAHQIPPRDRWAIAAYIKALQLSQAAPAAELDASDRAELARVAAGTAHPATANGHQEEAR